VSSCLLGEHVRFNGGHSRSRFLTGELGPHVDWVPASTGHFAMFPGGNRGRPDAQYVPDLLGKAAGHHDDDGDGHEQDHGDGGDTEPYRRGFSDRRRPKRWRRG
jgi:hypothetical protein